MTRKMKKILEKTLSEVDEFVRRTKPPREQINFKRKQLQFLKADVKKPQIPFRRCMLSLQRKKERRAENKKRKRDLGLL